MISARNLMANSKVVDFISNKYIRLPVGSTTVLLQHVLEAKCQGQNIECGHCITTQLQYAKQYMGRVDLYDKLLKVCRPLSLASIMIVKCLNTTVVTTFKLYQALNFNDSASSKSGPFADYLKVLL